jgi:tRNA-Thr(GGU) m(6)t(6)A37 methyltransferase TsaA
MPITYSPIGTIHTPFSSLEGMPIQPSGARDVAGTIILQAQYEAGLRDLEGFSHIFLVYHFHLSSGYHLTVTPYLDTVERGLFATRAPRRPNPIGLSIVRLAGIDGATLHIKDVDMADGTPLLDIKPWVPRFDMREDAKAGWLDTIQDRSCRMRSDRRFIEKSGRT